MLCIFSFLKFDQLSSARLNSSPESADLINFPSQTPIKSPNIKEFSLNKQKSIQKSLQKSLQKSIQKSIQKDILSHKQKSQTEHMLLCYNSLYDDHQNTLKFAHEMRKNFLLLVQIVRISFKSLTHFKIKDNDKNY